MIPVGVAVALIVLNVQSRFLGSNSEWSNLFQFIAKLHEILMQISIATAMLGYQQYLLTRSNSALPFGAIFSAYNATQVGYLWSAEFRASLTAQFPLLLKTGFLFFVPASILLASAVGPASAIAMLPRLVNFTIPDNQIGLDHTYSDLFPTAFNQPGGLLENNIQKQNAQSPAIGWEYLRNLPSVGQDQLTLVGLQMATEDLGNGNGRSYDVMPPLYTVDVLNNIWYTLSYYDRIIRTLSVQYAPNSTVATVQQVPVAAGLSTAAYNALRAVPGEAARGQASIQIAHPFVSSICMLNPVMNESDTRAIEFPATFLSTNATGVDTIPYTNITRQQLWHQVQDQGEGQIIWVDNVSFSTERTLGAIVVQPDFCDNGQKYLSMSACAVSGLWADMTAQIFVTTTHDKRAESLISRDYLNTLPPAASWPAVSISKEWANSITSQIANQNRTVADNLLRSLLLTEVVCPVNGSYTTNSTMSDAYRPMMHEAIISSLIANGMSYAVGKFITSDTRLKNGDFQWINSTNYGDESRPAGFIMSFQSSVEGYAWNMDGVAIKIAIPILLIYILYATGYIAYTLVTGHSTRAWDTMSSMTALAFNSRPSKVLENTSVRISQIETFRNLVSVQEVESEQRLELVFQQDEQDRAGLLRRVRAGKPYS
ncbi:hypothetical protein TSTA_094440 [Talaromyces stipitatus ATCC 10500]|uniref:Uncharacterized protein n=1 Tax=Talaromyces stipitatus (strain ATCC 10500 / CBS 375.48 / QM 6759 / NRRL 1006) TaxID=441959 RepID=B8M2U3_TALSN|nr:uncharacterized protein TSTA_094440 [Talaromyces stipitatus ATCC 10500]EED22198.1 hypothetical protein TSTA_094440 [Talaromyces stipitatus ATCC 10500]